MAFSQFVNKIKPFLHRMGCMESSANVTPNMPASHLNRLLQVSQISHPLNINKKYEHLSRIQASAETGQGIRKTCAWTALGTKIQIDSKIQEYWESRTNGQPHIWEAVRTLSRITDQARALNFMETHNLRMLKGSIQMCLDSRLNKYEIPVFCINEPLEYSVELLDDKNLNISYENKPMEVSIRSTRFPHGDIKMGQTSGSTVKQCKDRLKELKGLTVDSKIRFFYTGREMKDEKALGNYSYVAGTVIQAMIIQ